MNSRWVMIVLLVLIAAACTGRKKIISTTDTEVTEYQEREELMRALDSACCVFDGFEMKANLKFEQESQKMNFKTIFRINTDSVIWTSVSFSGIPVVQALFTKDSVKFLTRQPKKSFYLGTYAEINARFGLQLNYAFLQDFLYAKPLEFENSEHTVMNTLPDYYEFTIHDSSATLQLDEVIRAYQFSRMDLTYSKLQMQADKDSVNLKLDYEKYEKLDSCLFPRLISMFADKAGRETNVVIEINKITTGIQTDMPFKYGNNYERFEFGK